MEYVLRKRKILVMGKILSASVDRIMSLQIIAREGWIAREPPYYSLLKVPVDHVFFATTQTKICRHRVFCDGVVRRLQRFHTDIQSLVDIRYNFLIGGDGTVYEGRGWEANPELPKSYKDLNGKSVYIAYIGIFTADDLPKNMKHAGELLVSNGISSGLILQDAESHDITKDKDYYAEGTENDRNNS